MAGVEQEIPNLDKLLDKFGEAIVSLKHGLVDGKLDPDDIVNAIPDESAREDIRAVLVTLKGIFPEVKKIGEQGPFAMMMKYTPYLASKLMKVFA